MTQERIMRFAEDIKTRLETLLGLDYEVAIQEVAKGNDTKIAVTAVKTSKDRGTYTVGPVFYPADILEQYPGTDTRPGEMNRLIVEMARIVLNPPEYVNTGARQANEMLSWEKAKDKVMLRLINREMNEHLLTTVPHRNFLDLAVIYVLDFGSSPDEEASLSAKITNEIVSHWDVDEPELYATALKNMSEMTLKSEKVSNFICRMAGIPATVHGEDDMFLTYLTTEPSVFGACAMIIGKDKIREIAGQYKRDMYILPSSVHEVLLLPVTAELDEEFLLDMVRSINRTNLPTADVLSDNIYLYRRATDEIELITG